MRVAIYSRISTDRQSHSSQLAEVWDFCLRRGWNEPREYCDVMSGCRFTRRGLDALMAKVRRNSFDVIAVFKLDRLGRSLPHLATIVEELTYHGVALVCTSQGIDTTDQNPAGRLQLGVLMAVAEFEREIIRERVNAGLKAARARGTKLGRPETLSQHLPAIRLLVAQGMHLRAIARELNLAPSSVSKLIRLLKQQP